MMMMMFRHLYCIIRIAIQLRLLLLLCLIIVVIVANSMHWTIFIFTIYIIANWLRWYRIFILYKINAFFYYIANHSYEFRQRRFIDHISAHVLLLSTIVLIHIVIIGTSTFGHCFLNKNGNRYRTVQLPLRTDDDHRRENEK